jgi:hypothetical protein
MDTLMIVRERGEINASLGVPAEDNGTLTEVH